MKGGNKNSPDKLGFTIIEVMVFLAVSGLTFLIAAEFINGKQAQAQFTQGVNNALQSVRNVINNVSNGNYPPTGAAENCNTNSGVPNTNIRGSGCALVGEVIEPTGTNSYKLYTLVGCQFYDSLNSSRPCSNMTLSNYPEAFPQTLPQEDSQVLPELTTSGVWPGNLALKGIYILSSNGSHQATDAVGVFTSLPSINNGTANNASVPTQLVAFPGDNLSHLLTEIHYPANGGYLSPGNSVVFCFEGTNSKFASLEIGNPNGGEQTITTLDISGEQPCPLS